METSNRHKMTKAFHYFEHRDFSQSSRNILTRGEGQSTLDLGFQDRRCLEVCPGLYSRWEEPVRTYGNASFGEVWLQGGSSMGISIVESGSQAIRRMIGRSYLTTSFTTYAKKFSCLWIAYRSGRWDRFKF